MSNPCKFDEDVRECICGGPCMCCLEEPPVVKKGPTPREVWTDDVLGI